MNRYKLSFGLLSNEGGNVAVGHPADSKGAQEPTEQAVEQFLTFSTTSQVPATTGLLRSHLLAPSPLCQIVPLLSATLQHTCPACFCPSPSLPARFLCLSWVTVVLFILSFFLWTVFLQRGDFCCCCCCCLLLEEDDFLFFL